MQKVEMVAVKLPPPQLEQSWQSVLADEWKKPYIKKLITFLEQERRIIKSIYPPPADVFAAFRYTPFDEVQVVIMGQDPYHGKGQAHGLSFSVQEGVPFPPSLKNIFRELHFDLGIHPPQSGSLETWAKQGVLMLNAVLTVRAKSPRSHGGKGWEFFTDAVVSYLAKRVDPVIFVLWGKSAQEKCQPILEGSHGQHFVLTAPHPSPYSAYCGFFGCKHFSKINELLKRQSKQEIDWRCHG